MDPSDFIQRHSLSFSSEKEAEEPWTPPLLSLGNVMVDPEMDQLYKQLNINIVIKISLTLFIMAFTSTSQH